ncbi:MAG: hypothetical protein AAFV36_05065 [Myxococcota bacterium]
MTNSVRNPTVMQFRGHGVERTADADPQTAKEGEMLRLIRSTDWGALLEIVSPKFFEVLSAGALRDQLGGFFSRYRDKEAFAELLEARRDGLSELGVDLVDSVESGMETLPGAYGQKVLELYFWQLFAHRSCLLDLRSSRLRLDGERLRWKPARVYTEWNEDFIVGIRQLYASFYDGNDDGFREALLGLDLEDASEIFVEHFGGDDQRAVTFDLESFQKVFQRVFRRTQSAGKRLHPNFVGFGVYLGSLYENLSRFDIPFDVRAAVANARSQAEKPHTAAG